jgi:hypothetical protein
VHLNLSRSQTRLIPCQIMVLFATT